MTETMTRSRQFVLKPTPEQVEAFNQACGVARLVYNLGLEQRSTFWRQYKRAAGCHISHKSQCREATELRAQYDFIRAVNCDVPNIALRDLDRAFDAFFAGRSRYPTFRNKFEHNSFRTKGITVSTRALNAKWSEIRVPSIGWVKYRSTRPVESQIRTLAISLRGGKWIATVTCAVEARSTRAPGLVGIDRGVANTLALSNGELHSLPTSLHALVAKRKRAQRVLARRVRKSGRHAAQRAKVARISGHIARIRADWLHRQSTEIARRFGHVAIERLNIANMTSAASGTVDQPGKMVAQKRGLNRSILHQGWGIFARHLEYKVAERGGLLVYVNPAYSSQTCSACGAVDAENRKSQAVFKCVACGHEAHADVEAAKEILRRSTALKDVEGSRRRPAEASTRRAVA